MTFDYSQLDPETAEKLKKTSNEIHKIMDNVGNVCWKAGRKLIGEKATKDQIANFLSHQWHHDKDFLITCMNRVGEQWNSQ